MLARIKPSSDTWFNKRKLKRVQTAVAAGPVWGVAQVVAAAVLTAEEPVAVHGTRSSSR